MNKTPNMFATSHVADLAVEAVTECGGTVTNRKATLRKGAKGYIVRIEGTMGSWYVDSLLEVGNSIMIDAGRGSTCTNVRALLVAAGRIIRSLNDSGLECS